MLSWTCHVRPKSPQLSRRLRRVALVALNRCNSFAKRHDLANYPISIPSSVKDVASGTSRKPRWRNDASFNSFLVDSEIVVREMVELAVANWMSSQNPGADEYERSELEILAGH